MPSGCDCLHASNASAQHRCTQLCPTDEPHCHVTTSSVIASIIIIIIIIRSFINCFMRIGKIAVIVDNWKSHAAIVIHAAQRGYFITAPAACL